MPRGSVWRFLNPAWCERSLCCRGSGQPFAHIKVIRKLVMPRGSGNACSTLRGTKARCAGVVPSAWFSQAQLLVSLHRGRFMPQLGCLSMLSPNTRLQRTPLRVEQDRAFFKCQYLLQYRCHQSVAAPLKRNPLGRAPNARLARMQFAIFLLVDHDILSFSVSNHTILPGIQTCESIHTLSNLHKVTVKHST